MTCVDETTQWERNEAQRVPAWQRGWLGDEMSEKVKCGKKKERNKARATTGK